jgi:glycosyltransferase involved in cell wall biosynthesis
LSRGSLRWLGDRLLGTQARPQVTRAEDTRAVPADGALATRRDGGDAPEARTGSVSVALDAGPLLDPATGVGRYVRELGRSLEAIGVNVRRYAVSLRGRRAGSDIVRWRVPARWARAAWLRFDRPAITRLAGAADIVHATNFVLPPTGGAPGVVTVHDLSFLRDDTWPGGERLRALVPWSVRRAVRTIVPTDAIRTELLERYGTEEEHVVVTPEGVSSVFFGARPLADTALERMGVHRPFALAVGTIEPRKNLRRLLDAWGAARSELQGWTLVLAGVEGWGPRLPVTPGVVPIGWVGDETLPGLLAAADLFCYPSVYEGFGLPPLEAMAAGTPALVCRYSAAEEVVGDAALITSPTDVEEISAGLVRLAGDDALRRRLAMSGRARAARFTWERTAAATAAVYRSALEAR